MLGHPLPNVSPFHPASVPSHSEGHMHLGAAGCILCLRSHQTPNAPNASPDPTSPQASHFSTTLPFPLAFLKPPPRLLLITTWGRLSWMHVHKRHVPYEQIYVRAGNSDKGGSICECISNQQTSRLASLCQPWWTPLYMASTRKDWLLPLTHGICVPLDAGTPSRGAMINVSM